MAQNSAPQLSWEAFIKSLLGRLEIPSREEIEMINNRLERLEKKVLQKKTRSRKTRVRSAAASRKKKKTASDVVLEAIAGHTEGIDFKTIQAATGYEEKKLRNIIFRLDKLQRIVKEKRGIYRSA